MIKIEADTLEQAYADAASALKCSVIELDIELIQAPKAGYWGVFKKSAIIVATINEKYLVQNNAAKAVEEVKDTAISTKEIKIEENKNEKVKENEEPVVQIKEEKEAITLTLKSKLTNIIQSPFHHSKEKEEEISQIEKTAIQIEKEINELFDLTCFKIDRIAVKVYDEETVLVEFKGEDAALLIGKEGYRYKAISYMLFNWMNSKYKVQLRLEIAEFLKNQEESVSRYIDTICETIDNEGRAQTKVLDGVLIQIALKELREKYPNKYVVIRSGKDGMKYIIVNDYHSD